MIKKMTDEILDNPKNRDAKQKSQEEEVNACKLIERLSLDQRLVNCCKTFLVIQNSGTHMEHTILASLTSILIGFVVMENKNETIVRRYLRDGKFAGMVGTLMQYYEFLNLTVSVS